MKSGSCQNPPSLWDATLGTNELLQLPQRVLLWRCRARADLWPSRTVANTMPLTSIWHTARNRFVSARIKIYRTNHSSQHGVMRRTSSSARQTLSVGCVHEQDQRAYAQPSFRSNPWFSRQIMKLWEPSMSGPTAVRHLGYVWIMTICDLSPFGHWGAGRLAQVVGGSWCFCVRILWKLNRGKGRKGQTRCSMFYTLPHQALVCRRRGRLPTHSASRTWTSPRDHIALHPSLPSTSPDRVHVVPFRRSEHVDVPEFQLQWFVATGLHRRQDQASKHLDSIKKSIAPNKNVAESARPIFSLVSLLTNHQTISIVPFHIIAFVRVDPQQSHRLRTCALQALGP